MDIAIQEGSFNLVPIPGEAEGTMAGYYFRFTDPKSGISLVAPIPFAQAVELGKTLAAQGEQYTAGPVAGATIGPEISVATPADLQLVKDRIRPPGEQS